MDELKADDLGSASYSPQRDTTEFDDDVDIPKAYATAGTEEVADKSPLDVTLLPLTMLYCCWSI